MVMIMPEADATYSMVEQPRLPSNLPSGAEGIGALGDVAAAFAAKKVKAEQDRILRTARLAAVDQLDQLRHQYENDTSLDGLSGRWQADAAKLTAGVANTLPKHLQKDFALSMAEMIQPQTSALRTREDMLFKDNESAALNTDMRGFEKAAANAPTAEARDAIYREAAAAIGAGVDAGYLSRTEAEKMMHDIPANTENITALKMVDDDPAALLEWLGSGEGASLDPKTVLTFTKAARANIAAEETRTIRENELLAKAAEKEIGSTTDRAIKVMNEGVPFKGIGDLLQRTAGTPDGERLQAEVDALEKNAGFALMSPAQQDVELELARATATDQPTTAANVKRLESIATKTRESLKDDPLQHVSTRGIMPIEPVDITDPASVQTRRAKAETVYREFTPDDQTIRYLDKAEATRLSGIVAGPDIDQALGVLTAVTENFGEAAPAVMAQIGATDPIANLSGVLVSETGDITAARDMLRGRALLKEGKGTKPSAEVRRAAPSEFSTAFPANGDPRMQTLIAAADAHYAASGVVIADPKSPEAKAAYTASIQAAAGQVKRNDTTYGGFQPVNGQTTLLPPDLTAKRVESALTYFGPDHWKRASLSGNLPNGFANYSADHRADWTLLSLRDGSYALGYRQRSGEITYLKDGAQRDGVFRLDLHSLVTGASR